MCLVHAIVSTEEKFISFHFLDAITPLEDEVKSFYKIIAKSFFLDTITSLEVKVTFQLLNSPNCFTLCVNLQLPCSSSSPSKFLLGWNSFSHNNTLRLFPFLKTSIVFGIFLDTNITNNKVKVGALLEPREHKAASLITQLSDSWQ